MALIKCRECGKEVSDQAKTCPNCGCPINDNPQTQLNSGETVVNGVVINPKDLFIKNSYSPSKTSAEIVKLTGTDKQNADRIAAKASEIYRQEVNKKKKPALTVFLILLFILIVCGFGSVLSDVKEQQPNSNEKKNDNSKVESSAPVVVESEEPKETEEEYKASCSSDFKYKDVLRNPSDYVGKRIVIDVKVSSVHKEGVLTPVEYYFAWSNDEYDWWLGDQYGVFNYTDGNLKILEDDIIRVWGEISEPKDTTSIIVNSEEVFCIDMKYVELIAE